MSATLGLSQGVPYLMAALLAAMLAASAAQGAATDCAWRAAKAGQAWAIVRVRVLAASENAFASRGDHCDEQLVQGEVVETLKGPLKNRQPIGFSLNQGACGDPNSVNDAFTAPGAELVVMVQRDLAGGLYQTRAETADDYAAREAECRGALERPQYKASR